MKKRTHPVSLSLAILIAGACSESAPLVTPDKEICLVRGDGGHYCIELYEASHRDATMKAEGSDLKSPPRSLDGLMPWSMVTWEAAKTACNAKNKRLCEADEWIDACDGVPGTGGTKYAYGDTLDTMPPYHCNVSSMGPVPTGSFSGCRAMTGTFDQSGNVAEWTGNTKSAAAARGGSFRSSITHECTSDGMGAYDPDQESPEVGFRCCRD
jgi:formylglycine-generating enzyme required for sulfatase activity